MLKCANVYYLGNPSDKWLYVSVLKDSLVVLPSYKQLELLTVTTQELYLGTVVGDEKAREPESQTAWATLCEKKCLRIPSGWIESVRLFKTVNTFKKNSN